uniref:Uncharacterized protein n=1 Tax=viral metagenome TaxID=1070528 RepID=A0A6C0AE00_9ZZZZ
MEIKISEVPKYLRKSELYKNFNHDDDSIIIAKYMKNSDKEFNNFEDLKEYFKTANFWDYNLDKYISEEAKKFILENKKLSIPLLYKYDISKNMVKNINSISDNLVFDIKDSRHTYIITISLKNQENIIWKLEVDDFEITFEKEIFDNFFEKLFLSIENNLNFDDNFLINYELKRSRNDLLVLYKYIKVKYSNKIISFIFATSEGEGHKTQSKIKYNKLFNIKVTDWNKESIIKSLKKANKDFNFECEEREREMEEEENIDISEDESED